MLFHEIEDKLRESNVLSPKLEARMIFGHFLGVDYSFVSGREPVSEEQKEMILQAVNKRLNGYPLDKILGTRSFYKYDFVVDENVLSPRPETELLVENAIEIIKKHGFASILELGVGSGCVILSIIKEIDSLIGCGIDISEEALSVANKNADNLGISDRVDLRKFDWNDERIKNSFSQKFNIIVSNPPYIPNKDRKELMKEVRLYDPQVALYGGDDGLDAYRRIAEITPSLLETGGFILLEVGINQEKAVAQIFKEAGFELIDTKNDLAGIPRCIILKK